jgi:hypothetical protein
MLRNKPWLILLSLSLLLFGCAQVPLDLQKFDPAADLPQKTVFQKDNETYLAFEDKTAKVSTAIYEYNTVIVIPLEITNKTGQDIANAEYTITLADGRDRKTVKLISRDDLVKIKGKYSGGGSSALQDQVIETTITSLMNAVNLPTKDRLIKIIDQGIDQYFEFRPIYARETRSGVLCFIPDFKLEYPLTLSLKIKGEPIDLQFFPRVKK